MSTCKDCQFYLQNALVTDMGTCRKISLHGPTVAIVTPVEVDWAALSVSSDFGCNLFEAK